VVTKPPVSEEEEPEEVEEESDQRGHNLYQGIEEEMERM